MTPNLRSVGRSDRPVVVTVARHNATGDEFRNTDIGVSLGAVRVSGVKVFALLDHGHRAPSAHGLAARDAFDLGRQEMAVGQPTVRKKTDDEEHHGRAVRRRNTDQRVGGVGRLPQHL